MAERERRLRELEKETWSLEAEKAALEASNGQMSRVVGEYERTISELISDRERQRVVRDIDRERLAGERAQAAEDLAAAEAAFNDVHRKCDRTKEVISAFQATEDELKVRLEEVAAKARKAEERFQVLKAHAEEKLAE